MSIWCNVSCEFRFPEPVSKEELEKHFGKELVLDWNYPDYDYKEKFGEEAWNTEYVRIMEKNEKAWADYEAHKDEYLPAGSEGSLTYVPCRRSARKGSDGRYVYKINGSLRNFDDDMGVVRHMMDKYLRLINKHNDWTFKTYALIEASSGVGQWTWEDGKYN